MRDRRGQHRLEVPLAAVGMRDSFEDLWGTFSSPRSFQQRCPHRSGMEWSMLDFTTPGESLGAGNGDLVGRGTLGAPQWGWGGHHGPMASPFHHVLVDHSGDDGQGDHVPGPCQHLHELLILRERSVAPWGAPIPWDAPHGTVAVQPLPSCR